METAKCVCGKDIYNVDHRFPNRPPVWLHCFRAGNCPEAQPQEPADFWARVATTVNASRDNWGRTRNAG